MNRTREHDQQFTAELSKLADMEPSLAVRAFFIGRIGLYDKLLGELYAKIRTKVTLREAVDEESAAERLRLMELLKNVVVKTGSARKDPKCGKYVDLWYESRCLQVVLSKFEQFADGPVPSEPVEETPHDDPPSEERVAASSEERADQEEQPKEVAPRRSTRNKSKKKS